jgi:replicative DNA helicase
MPDDIILQVDMEAEQGVIGCLLVDCAGTIDVCRRSIGNRRPFTTKAHNTIYLGIIATADRHPDGMTMHHLVAALKDAGVLEECGGQGYIGNLVAKAPTSTMVDFYLDRMLKTYVRRETVFRLSKIVNACSGTTDPASLMEDLSAALIELTDATSRPREARLADLVDGAIEHVKAVAAHDPTKAGLPTGYAALDWLMHLRPSEMIVIAGRPSTGKTTLAVDIARSLAERKLPVGIASLEMDQTQLVVRMLCGKAEVSYGDLRSPSQQGMAIGRIQQAGTYLRMMEVLIDDTPNLGIYDIRATARRMKMLHGIKAFIIDYLQIVRPGDRRQTREAQVAEISRNVKAMAKDLNIPVIVLAQLNRIAETEKPRVSHLRESGSIEQDADVIILLDADRMADRVNGCLPVNAVVAKNRNGPVGIAHLLFSDKTTHFYEDTRAPTATDANAEDYEAVGKLPYKDGPDNDKPF